MIMKLILIIMIIYVGDRRLHSQTCDVVTGVCMCARARETSQMGLLV